MAAKRAKAGAAEAPRSDGFKEGLAKAGLTLVSAAPVRAAEEAPRFVEVDVARGVAIVAMILFHASYDVASFRQELVSGPSPLIPAWYWYVAPKLIGSSFFLIVGISAWLRVRASERPRYLPFVKRASRILGAALLVTATSALLFPRDVIYFGVLHCIGVSVLLLYPFLRFSELNLALGATLVAIGAVVTQADFHGWAWMWLGFKPLRGWVSDWYPLLPWFGVALLGIRAGRFLYPSGRPPRWSLDQGRSRRPLPRSLRFLGRNSLAIYLAHQPILMGIFWLFLRR